MPKYESSRLKLGELALSVNFSKKGYFKKIPHSGCPQKECMCQYKEELASTAGT